MASGLSHGHFPGPDTHRDHFTMIASAIIAPEQNRNIKELIGVKQK
jgi:hypothetical protein